METILLPEIGEDVTVKPKPKIEDQPTGYRMAIAISTNCLAILKNFPAQSVDDVEVLLPGNDHRCSVLFSTNEEGDKELYTIIDLCYKAREEGKAFVLKRDNVHIVTFR